jgi:predicted transcriptional regulator
VDVAGLVMEAVKWLQENSTILSLAISSASLVVFTFNLIHTRRSCKLLEMGRERRMVVELLKFCIPSLKDWLFWIKDFNEVKELSEKSWEEIAGIFVRRAERSDMYVDPRTISIGFHTLLRRSRRERKWEKRMKKFDDYQRYLPQKMEELREALKEFIERRVDEIRERYCEIVAKEELHYRSFEDFKEVLSDPRNFYKLVRAEKLERPWEVVGNELFDSARNDSRIQALLQEIDEVVKQRNEIIDQLITELDEIREKLIKDYRICPSELGEKRRLLLRGF